MYKLPKGNPDTGHKRVYGYTVNVYKNRVICAIGKDEKTGYERNCRIMRKLPDGKLRHETNMSLSSFRRGVKSGGIVLL